MISEGLVYFAILLAVAVPLGLIAVFASIAVVSWRQGRPRTGLLLAGIATFLLAMVTMPLFLRAHSVLELLSIRFDAGYLIILVLVILAAIWWYSKANPRS